MSYINDSVLLEKLISHLYANYNVTVKVIQQEVKIKDEVAWWRKWIVTINSNYRSNLWTAFMLAHVFWHFVQFSELYSKYEKMWNIMDNGSFPRTEQFKSSYFLYEKEAWAYWKWLIDQFYEMNKETELLYKTFLDTDYSHYWQFLITGEKFDPEYFSTEWIRRYESWIMENDFSDFIGITPPKSFQSIDKIYAREISVV